MEAQCLGVNDFAAEGAAVVRFDEIKRVRRRLVGERFNLRAGHLAFGGLVPLSINLDDDGVLLSPPVFIVVLVVCVFDDEALAVMHVNGFVIPYVMTIIAVKAKN